MKIGLHLSMLCQNWTDDPSVYLEELKEALSRMERFINRLRAEKTR